MNILESFDTARIAAGAGQSRVGAGAGPTGRGEMGGSSFGWVGWIELLVARPSGYGFMDPAQLF